MTSIIRNSLTISILEKQKCAHSSEQNFKQVQANTIALQEVEQSFINKKINLIAEIYFLVITLKKQKMRMESLKHILIKYIIV